jgi:protein TonB
MFELLPESRAVRRRSPGGTLASVTLHVVGVGALVAVTARAAVPRVVEPLEVPLSYTEITPPLPAPPPARLPATPGSAAAGVPSFAPAPLLVAPDVIPDLPPIDLSAPPTRPEDFASGRRGTISGVPDGRGGAGGAGGEPGAYFDWQVERPVVPRPGNVGPAYPDLLRTAGIEGTVLAQFVVDTMGRVVPSTFTVVKSDHPLFAQAVERALTRMRFLPAEVGGRKVPQLVVQPFQFNMR